MDGYVVRRGRRHSPALPLRAVSAFGETFDVVRVDTVRGGVESSEPLTLGEAIRSALDTAGLLDGERD